MGGEDAVNDEHDVVTIDPHFHGPPGSGNGGYTCGLAASLLTEDRATVRLHRPPPLGVPLDVHRSDGRVDLAEGDEVVATALRWAGPTETPVAPAADGVDAAIAAFDVAAYETHHPFPGCFTCGPQRPVGEGLRIFPAPIEGSAAVVWRWRAATAHADGDGRIRPEVVWAALDCPGGMAWMHGGDRSEPGPLVLGQLSVAILRRPTVAEELVVSGWREGSTGRRCHAGTAAWTRDGELIAQGAATWIRLDADQAAAFAANSAPPL